MENTVIMQHITLSTIFLLVFKVKKSDIVKVEKILTDNLLSYEGWKPCVFSGFVEYRVKCNLRKAELVRQLLKNLPVYE